MSRRILIAYDHSEDAKRAIQWVLDHSILLPADVVIIATVVNEEILTLEGEGAFNTSTVGGTEYLVSEYYQRVEELEHQVNAALNQVVERFRSYHLNVTGKLIKGEVTDTLTAFAKDEHIDMVIVGSRGLGFLKRKFLGSVSESLSHHLECPILIVKTQ